MTGEVFTTKDTKDHEGRQVFRTTTLEGDKVPRLRLLSARADETAHGMTKEKQVLRCAQDDKTVGRRRQLHDDMARAHL